MIRGLHKIREWAGILTSRCPQESVTHRLFVAGRIKRNEENAHRRAFLIFSGLLLAKCLPRKLFAAEGIKVYKQNKIPVVRRSPVTPPGAKSISNYTTHCVDCRLCVSFCPSSVIKPASFSFNGKRLSMPLMDNKYGYCNYKCTICGEICPTDAILPLTLEEKKTTQIGKVRYIKENCIVTLQGTECGACSEHCPTKAVSMVLEKNLHIPKINVELCVGCGACEYICPAIPNKAIYVEGNEIHQNVVLPKPGKSVTEDVMEDFPF